MRNFCLALATFGIGAAASAADWPNWLGPNKNGASPETGLSFAWSAKGPKLAWEAPGGDGYSTIAVAGGKAITLVQKANQEVVVALDSANGKPLWETPLGPAFKNQYGNGPRSTPCIEGEKVYVQSVNGPLACLSAADGRIVWQKHLLKEFGAKNITWGLSASPVVAGNLVLGVAGGKGATAVAFDKATGAVVWKAGSDKAAYASPVVADVGGEKQAIFFTASRLFAVSLADGKELWSIAWPTEFDCNIATPQLAGGDRLFVSSGEGNGCVMFQLKKGAAPTVAWESKGKKSAMICYWATPVLHEGHLYGLAGEFSNRVDLRCVDAATGKVKWSQDGFGKAAVTLADGHLLLSTKAGDLVVVRAAPTAFAEVARATLLGDNRTAPTLANGKLYLRDLKKIVCVDLR